MLHGGKLLTVESKTTGTSADLREASFPWQSFSKNIWRNYKILWNNLFVNAQTLTFIHMDNYRATSGKTDSNNYVNITWWAIHNWWWYLSMAGRFDLKVFVNCLQEHVLLIKWHFTFSIDTTMSLYSIIHENMCCSSVVCVCMWWACIELTGFPSAITPKSWTMLEWQNWDMTWASWRNLILSSITASTLSVLTATSVIWEPSHHDPLYTVANCPQPHWSKMLQEVNEPACSSCILYVSVYLCHSKMGACLNLLTHPLATPIDHLFSKSGVPPYMVEPDVACMLKPGLVAHSGWVRLKYVTLSLNATSQVISHQCLWMYPQKAVSRPTMQTTKTYFKSIGKPGGWWLGDSCCCEPTWLETSATEYQTNDCLQFMCWTPYVCI